jgi:SAM-dependent methyltransferase
MFKTTAKRLLRPFSRRVASGLQNRIDGAVGRAEVRLDHLELITARDVEAMKGYLPALLNTIATQAAAARQMQRSIDELRHHAEDQHQRVDDQQRQLDALGNQLSERLGRAEQRAEFIRKETMYELRYGGHGPGANGQVKPRILDNGKLTAFGDDIRLNLGCGHIAVRGYINVDSREIPGVDIVADVRDLPFSEGQVGEIYSAHLLEHFPEEELARSLLPYWYSLLRPGGRLVAVVPDTEMMLSEHAAGRVSFDDLRDVTFGEQEYAGNFHYTMFSQRSLCELLEMCGFSSVSVKESARRNGVCYEMEVSAHKADAATPAQE